MPSLSIVIPAYNEAANVVPAIEDIAQVAQDLKVDYEIILVNDGSRDATGELARTQLAPRIPNFKLVEHFPNRGYGGALKAGFAAATKDLIAFTPADKQFDFKEITRLLDKLTPDMTLVSGWRVNRQDPLIRRLNGMGWNLVVAILFGRLDPRHRLRVQSLPARGAVAHSHRIERRDDRHGDAGGDAGARLQDDGCAGDASAAHSRQSRPARISKSSCAPSATCSNSDCACGANCGRNDGRPQTKDGSGFFRPPSMVPRLNYDSAT